MILQVGVKVCLYDSDGRVLLIRRARAVSDGSIVWDIPGGRIYAEEPLEAGIRRELFEECGITTHLDAELFAAQDIFAGTDRHVVRLTYRATIDQPTIELSDEHDAYEWVSLGDLPNYALDPLIRALFDQTHTSDGS